MRRLSLLLLLLIVTFIYSSCARPRAFEYRDLRNFRVENWGFDKSRVAMDLVFFNPNNYGVNLKKIDCDVFLDNNYVGKFLLDTLIHIPKTAEFGIPARFDVDMRNIFKNSINAVFKKEVVVGARGTTLAGKGGFYITIPFHYEGKQKLNLLQF